MSLIAHFFSHPIPAVVVLLGLLVFFHELGHYVVGRACGIAVETFSIGFGPRIFGWTRRGTEYRVSWIPLGGFVKFAGAHPSEEVPPHLEGRGFLETPLLGRALTVLAGPFFNFVLAVGVYTALGMSGVSHPPPLIGEVLEGSPAAAAGLRYNDRLVKIGDRAIKTWRDLEEVISTSPGKTLPIVVDRGGKEESLTLTPDAVKTTDMAGRPATLGRAGVALGRLPAVVAVLAADGAAAKAGLATGDQVTQTTVGAATKPVAYYPDLVAAVREALASGQTSLPLTAQSAPVPSEKGEDKPASPAGPARQVTLPLDAAKALAANASDRELMRSLGLSDAELTIAEATEGAAALLKRGDVLVGWNGKPVRDVFALRDVLIANDQPEVTLTVLRDHAPVDVKTPLKGIEAQRPDGTVTIYTLPVLFWGQPVEPEPIVEKYGNPIAALGYGLRQTADQTHELVLNVLSLITGDIPLKALGGPMLIAKVAGDSARRGLQTFLGSMALISINLGLLNLFPIPVLDGGQLVLMGAEAVRRRPLREAAIENFQKVGFAMILALVVLATYNDLSRFWKSMLESVVGIFQ